MNATAGRTTRRLCDCYRAPRESAFGISATAHPEPGSGQRYSVLEAVAVFESASSRTVPYDVVGSRPGDAANTVADPALALRRLGWKTRRSLMEICSNGWAWQVANPYGYVR